MKDEISANTALNLLSLEDSILDFEIIRDQLINAGYDLNISRVEKESEFTSLLRNNKYDIILADFNLPGFDAFGALRLCNEICPNVPFICFSGSIGEETAIELLKLGAVDYVLKDRPERLLFAIKRALDEAKEKEIRQKVEKAFFQSEVNFRRSISDSPIGIRIVSEYGETIYVNKAFLEVYEFSSLEDFTGTPAKKRYTPESYMQHKERKEKRRNGQDVFDYEISLVSKNGKIRHVKVVRKEVLWNGIKHYQIINQDITEQKKLMADLIAAKEKAEESERLKTAFLANMSHEIRTPMNGILGFAGLLKEPNLTGAKQQEYINIIEKSGARMLNIIKDIIDISRIEAGLIDVKIKESNINEQVEFIYTIFKPEVEGKGMKFYFKNSLPSNEAIIKTDEEKIYAILTHLVKNAIKFSFGGTIEFGYDCVETHGRASLHRVASRHLQFFVKDTGIGIPKDRQEAIFEHFVQADIGDKRAFQGAGLGLSITKAYVEMLGGKIWVDSEVGKGSTFYFTIPYNNETIEEKVNRNAVSGDEAQNKIKPLKILIAEDDETSTTLIALEVNKISYEVLKVRTGIEAVEACLKNPDVDLVLMDIKMPVMNGYEAIRQIREFNKNVIIIAQSAYALTGDGEKGIEAGCNDYISKPIEKEKLIEMILHHFEQ